MSKFTIVSVASVLSLCMAFPAFAAVTTNNGMATTSAGTHTTYTPSAMTDASKKVSAKTMQGTIKSVNAASVVFTASGADYTATISKSTLVWNRMRKAASLTQFNVGDMVRVYGVATGTVIDAQIVRDTSIPVVAKPKTNTKHATSSTMTH